MRKGSEGELGMGNATEAVMDLNRLEVILCESTGLLNDGEKPAEGMEVVDMFLRKVGVVTAKAQQYKEELASIMRGYPLPSRLKVGPSYVELAGTIFEDNHESAFRLMALGKAAGIWDVLTPKDLGIDEKDAARLAQHGVVAIDGFDVELPSR